MWFRLNTVFTESLGKLDELTNSWSIIRDLRNFSTDSDVTSVTKDDSYSAVFTLNSDCTYTSHSVTMGGEVVSASQAVWDASTGELTVNIAKVTADVSIKAYASKNSTGGGGGSEGGDEPTDPTPGGTVISYTSRQSSSGISKSTGKYLSSSTGYVNIYENIDPTKTYAATGYAPASTGDNACVCYYTSDGTFISAESGSDWGISSVEYTMHELTIPSNASIIKLFGRTNNQESVLYLTSTISLSEISYSSQKTSSNLSKITGEYGSSSTGYVNIYDNIDVSKTYYGSGFCPNASGTAAAVCYYTSSGTFISAQDGNDFGVSSAGFVKQKLTVPSTTSTIKIFAQQKSAYPNEPDAALYVEQ